MASDQNFTQTSANVLEYDALLFDLDGVITPTAELHKEAWGRMFTAFLQDKGARLYTEQDYFDYLDGRRRDEGVQAVLASRNITLPIGDPHDGPGIDSVHGLGARKNQDFLNLVAEGVDAYPGSLRLLDYLNNPHVRPGGKGTEKSPAQHAEVAGAVPKPQIAIVSSSKNARPVLEAAGLLDRFPVIVDGNLAAERGLPGKPAPDTYLYAAKLLGVDPSQAVVLEDATSGVASGRAGNFGLVIGVDRGTGRQALLQAGADRVVADLSELVPAPL